MHPNGPYHLASLPGWELPADPSTWTPTDRRFLIRLAWGRQAVHHAFAALRSELGATWDGSLLLQGALGPPIAKAELEWNEIAELLAHLEQDAGVDLTAWISA